MNELELLKKLIELEQKSNDLKIQIQIETDEDKKPELINKRENIETEVESYKNQLLKINDKSFSAKAKSALIRQLDLYVTQINKASPGLKLSRDQSLITRNELFSGIVRDLNYLITDQVYSIRIPANLKYTRDPKDSIGISDLTDFINSELVILRNIHSPNYIELRIFVEGLTQRIIEKFIR
jgi:hypothetical protein